MSEISITLVQLAAIVFVAVALATTDAAALSRLGIAYLAKKMGMEPKEIMRYQQATEDSDGDEGNQADG